jgi:hypothetical protein
VLPSECRSAGIIPADEGIRNLLWDRKNKKLSSIFQPLPFADLLMDSYIVDFDMWYKSVGDGEMISIHNGS